MIDQGKHIFNFFIASLSCNTLYFGQSKLLSDRLEFLINVDIMCETLQSGNLEEVLRFDATYGKEFLKLHVDRLLEKIIVWQDR